MTVEVLLFASLKDAARADFIRVEVREPATVARLLEAVARQHPELAPYLPHCRVAVAQEYANADTLIHPSDEIALLPPVSGG